MRHAKFYALYTEIDGYWISAPTFRATAIGLAYISILLSSYVINFAAYICFDSHDRPVRGPVCPGQL